MNSIIYYFQQIFSLTFIIKSLIALSICLFFYIFRNLFALLITKLLNIKTKSKNKLKKTAFYKPLKIFFALLGLYLSIIYLNIGPKLNVISTKLFRISIIALITNGVANILNKDSVFFEKYHKKLTSKLDNTLTIFISKLFRVIIYSLGAVIIISELGYDVNGIIAGIGLGGLTIALAAQDAAKNIFGGIIIILDKPFTVGDWISTSTLEGTVEDITFRSTRIRTFDNSVVTIPNNTLANDSIVNWSRMYKRRVKFDIQIEYGTPLSKIKSVTTKIEELLNTHPEINKEVVYVRFTEFASDGLNIFIQYFTNTTNYAEYLKTKEDINMRILDILEKENVNLAFKTQTIHVKK